MLILKENKMLAEKTRSFVKDALLVSAVFATITGAYLGFAVAERYRGLTRAYIAQSQALINVLETQNGQSQQEVVVESDGQ
jgi:hypothetical protein